MDLASFNHKSLHQKTNLLWDQGEFLAVRCTNNCNVCLYAMGNFFAEIWYRLADNEVNSIKVFSSATNLDPYLEMVDLSEIAY